MFKSSLNSFAYRLMIITWLCSFLLFVSGCANSEQNEGSSEHDATASSNFDIPSSDPTPSLTIGEAEYSSFAIEVLEKHLVDELTDQMSPDAFITQYGVQLIRPSNLPSSYQYIDTVFVRDLNESSLIAEQIWIDAENREYFLLQQIIRGVPTGQDSLLYTDAVASVSSFSWAAHLETTFDNQLVELHMFMEKNQGEEYCKKIMSALEYSS